MKRSAGEDCPIVLRAKNTHTPFFVELFQCAGCSWRTTYLLDENKVGDYTQAEHTRTHKFYNFFKIDAGT
jgi:hypothetical protein